MFAARPDLVERSSRLTIEQLAEIRGLEPDLQVVDIRNPGETAAGVLPGAVEMPLPTLVDNLGALQPDRPTVVYCAGGYRSAIASSVLRAAGFEDVSDIVGGYGAWSGAGLPTSASASASGAGGEQVVSMTVEVPEVTPEDAGGLLDAGALLLDVREHDEWDAGHAPTASHVPMREVPARIAELPSDRRIARDLPLGRAVARGGRGADRRRLRRRERRGRHAGLGRRRPPRRDRRRRSRRRRLTHPMANLRRSTRYEPVQRRKLV